MKTKANETMDMSIPLRMRDINSCYSSPFTSDKMVEGICCEVNLCSVPRKGWRDSLAGSEIRTARESFSFQTSKWTSRTGNVMTSRGLHRPSKSPKLSKKDVDVGRIRTYAPEGN